MIGPIEAEGKEPVCIIYHGEGTGPEELDGSSRQRWMSARELGSGGTIPSDVPAVFVVNSSVIELAQQSNLPPQLVRVAADEKSLHALGALSDLSLVGVTDPAARRELMRAASKLSCARLASLQRRKQLQRLRFDLRELNAIGLALMSELDRDALLDQIVTHGKRLTESDGAALFVLDEADDGAPVLRLEHYKVDSLPDLPVFLVEDIPLDGTSIVGYAAWKHKHLVIEDSYAVPASAPYRRNPLLEARYGYHVKSMLIVPMLDHYQRLVGVLVFVNRKPDPATTIRNAADAARFVLSYDGPTIRLARSLAGQAAVSIENAQLHARVEEIFGGFIRASVTAVEQRDPSTAGHSLRVARLTKDLALALGRARTGKYRGVRFTRRQLRELYYASLLHDFGKITVDEDVLVKAKKLPPVLYERVTARFALIRCSLESQYYRDISRLESEEDAERLAAQLATDLASNLEELERWRTIVERANEPNTQRTPPDLELDLIARHTFVRPDETVAPYLTAEEVRYLKLPEGTLDDRERAAMEQHAEETFRFLSAIPWTEDLSHMPVYARDHHEKLDGTGYPRRLTADDISLQTRLITVADIFDALTASDRPYKPAVSVPKALAILEAEAKAGHLDAEIVRILSASRAYERILDSDWREF